MRGVLHAHTANAKGFIEKNMYCWFLGSTRLLELPKYT